MSDSTPQQKMIKPRSNHQYLLMTIIVFVLGLGAFILINRESNSTINFESILNFEKTQYSDIVFGDLYSTYKGVYLSDLELIFNGQETRELKILTHKFQNQAIPRLLYKKLLFYTALINDDSSKVRGLLEKLKEDEPNMEVHQLWECMLQIQFSGKSSCQKSICKTTDTAIFTLCDQLLL